MPIDEDPAGYPETDVAEVDAVVTAQHLIDSSRIKEYFDKRDKTPNKDGHFELVNDRGIPRGTVEVQIKKLYSKMTDPPKHRLKVKTLAYAQYCSTPFLLIGVDGAKNIAYWRNLSVDYVDNLDLKQGQKTKTIYFPQANIIDGTSELYITEWEDILEKHRERIHRYPTIKKQYEQLRSRANPAVGVERDEFASLHTYLDQLNCYFDNQYSFIKQRLFGSTWKIGLAYGEYTPDSLYYGLYPIPQNRNDVQIKEIDGDILDELKDTNHVKSVPYNPIEEDPRQHALTTIQSRIAMAIGPDILPLSRSSFLAREYVFAFADEFREYMGLSYDNSYSIGDLSKGYLRLQTWVEDALSEIETYPSKMMENRQYTVNPNLLEESLPDDSDIRPEIYEGEEVKGSRTKFIIGSDKVWPGLFEDSIQQLSDDGREIVNRPYIGEYPFYTDIKADDKSRNVRILLENFRDSYDQVISSKFPEVEELRFIQDADLYVSVVDENVDRFAGFRTRAFVAEKAEEVKYIVCSPGDELAEKLSDIFFGESELLTLDGIEYRLAKQGGTNITNVDSRHPLSELVYSRLEDSVEDYLHELSEHQTKEFVSQL